MCRDDNLQLNVNKRFQLYVCLYVKGDTATFTRVFNRSTAVIC